MHRLNQQPLSQGPAMPRAAVAGNMSVPSRSQMITHEMLDSLKSQNEKLTEQLEKAIYELTTKHQRLCFKSVSR